MNFNLFQLFQWRSNLYSSDSWLLVSHTDANICTFKRCFKGLVYFSRTFCWLVLVYNFNSNQVFVICSVEGFSFHMAYISIYVSISKTKANIAVRHLKWHGRSFYKNTTNCLQYFSHYKMHMSITPLGIFSMAIGMIAHTHV